MFDAVLNQLGMGVVIVNHDLAVLLVNEVADWLLSGDELRVQDGRLKGCMQPITNRIQQMVTAALQDKTAPEAISIPRPSSSPIELLVSPMGGDNRSAAMVFLFDPESRHSPSVDILISLYQLTQAEANLVELLAGGISLGDAGEALGISKQTARNQLQAAYRKTGTNHQSKLVKHVHTGAAGFVLRSGSETGKK